MAEVEPLREQRPKYALDKVVDGTTVGRLDLGVQQLHGNGLRCLQAARTSRAWLFSLPARRSPAVGPADDAFGLQALAVGIRHSEAGKYRRRVGTNVRSR